MKFFEMKIISCREKFFGKFCNVSKWQHFKRRQLFSRYNSHNEENQTVKQKNIEKATKAKNPLQFMEGDLKYTTAEGQQYTLYCCTKANAEPKILKWAFKLAERNVGPLYKTLKMGWQPKIKQTELNKNWARYLVALDEKKNPVAYSMFRFDLDAGFSVLYCYEMQIDAAHHHRGLGRFMMGTLEACARFWHLNKIVLTVLNNNENGKSFFNALGYVQDETSPFETDEVEYKILSKQLRIN